MRLPCAPLPAPPTGVSPRPPVLLPACLRCRQSVQRAARAARHLQAQRLAGLGEGVEPRVQISWTELPPAVPDGQLDLESAHWVLADTLMLLICKEIKLSAASSKRLMSEDLPSPHSPTSSRVFAAAPVVFDESMASHVYFCRPPALHGSRCEGKSVSCSFGI